MTLLALTSIYHANSRRSKLVFLLYASLDSNFPGSSFCLPVHPSQNHGPYLLISLISVLNTLLYIVNNRTKATPIYVLYCLSSRRSSVISASSRSTCLSPNTPTLYFLLSFFMVKNYVFGNDTIIILIEYTV